MYFKYELKYSKRFGHVADDWLRRVLVLVVKKFSAR